MGPWDMPWDMLWDIALDITCNFYAVSHGISHLGWVPPAYAAQLCYSRRRSRSLPYEM